MLELFRAAGAILLSYDVIISARAGTQVGKCGRMTIFSQARVSRSRLSFGTNTTSLQVVMAMVPESDFAGSKYSKC